MNPIHPTVVWLTWRQTFANRRGVMAILLAFAPSAIAYAFHAFPPAGTVTNRSIYLSLELEIVMGTILPLAALVFGTTAFGGEIDDGTLVYLLVKPVARWRVVLSKYVVAVGATFAVMLPALVIPRFILGGTDIPFSISLSLIWGVALGCAIYGALFTMLGLTVKHALAVGLIYVIVIEEVLTRAAAGARSISVREFSKAFALQMADPALNLGTPAVTAETIRSMGGLFLVAGLAVAVWRLSRHQMAERP